MLWQNRGDRKEQIDHAGKKSSNREETTQGPDVDRNFSELRQALGFTVREVAEELEISVSTAYRYDSGESTPRVAEIRAMEGLALARRPRGKKSPPQDGWFRFIDLFAGIGGLRRGFEAIGGKCVFTSEWDEHAQKTYRANFRCDHAIGLKRLKGPVKISLENLMFCL